MECALCLESRKLCNSHIVPRFIFDRLREEDGTFFVVSTGEEEPRRFHRTFSEKLLCSPCEERLSRWEGYASRVFSGGVPLTGVRHGKALYLKGIDYSNFKLFLMSLLWRFSVTQNPWLGRCDIGPHSERLRKQAPESHGAWSDAYLRRQLHIAVSRFQDVCLPTDCGAGTTRREAGHQETRRETTLMGLFSAPCGLGYHEKFRIKPRPDRPIR